MQRRHFRKPKEVTDVYTQWGCEMPVNAGRGSYRLAAQAEQQIRETRGKLAKYVHALSDEDVYFTASATMAANVILQGFPWKKGDIVFVSPYEQEELRSFIAKSLTAQTTRSSNIRRGEASDADTKSPQNYIA